MKTVVNLLIMGIAGLFIPSIANAQSAEVEQLLLNVEKLRQFKQILGDMKTGYHVLESRYNTVRDISRGNFSLHKAFLDGLLQVSPTVRNYKRVADIVSCQLTLVKEYKSAFNRYKQDDYFNPGELAYLERVYSNLFKASLRNLDELLLVITSGSTRMGDDERLQSIDRIYKDMEDKLQFLRYFNNNTSVLAVQRARERKDAVTLRGIYGITN